MAEKIKVCNFDKKQRTKKKLRKLLHVRKKCFLSEKENQIHKNIEKKHEKIY